MPQVRQIVAEPYYNCFLELRVHVVLYIFNLQECVSGSINIGSTDFLSIIYQCCWFFFSDGALVEEFFPDKLTQFKKIDVDTKKKFEAQYGKYKKSESPYSIQVENILKFE